MEIELKKNKQAIIDYFISGIKSRDNQKLGVEVEHIVATNDGRTVGFYGEFGVEQLLIQLKNHYDSMSFGDDRVLGLVRPHCTISIEPSAQLEASMGEFEKVSELIDEYNKFLTQVNTVLAKREQKLVAVGYNPYNKADELGLIPKYRYKLMNDYFKAQGDSCTGIQMMRCSCATQISIDYISERDFSIKFRLAMALTPILAYIYDNVDIYEGKKAPRLVRYNIWNNLDKLSERTGFVAKCFEQELGFESYADYIMNSQPIFIYNENQEVVPTFNKTIAEIYNNHKMKQKDIEHALSMVFPFVRLKKYIEIRMADSMDINGVQNYLQVVKAVFYNVDNLKILIDMTACVDIDKANLAWRELIDKGDDAIVYGVDIKKWRQVLSEMSKDVD